LHETKNLAKMLQQHGVSPTNPVVAVYMPRSVQYFIAATAALLAGGALFAMDGRLHYEAVRVQANVAGTAVIVSTQALSEDGLAAVLGSDIPLLISDVGWEARVEARTCMPTFCTAH
jgi:acyl-coenzyme A synthetase/AMP-(fatty) acid ligase